MVDYEEKDYSTMQYFVNVWHNALMLDGNDADMSIMYEMDAVLEGYVYSMNMQIMAPL